MANVETTPRGSAAGTGPDASARRTARLMDELTQLLQRSPAPAEFHAEFLKRVLTAMRGIAGGVWIRNPQGRLDLPYQINLSEVGLDKIPGARACHAELLRQVQEKGESLWVPPRTGPEGMGDAVVGANLTGYALLLAPILVDRETVGIVEIWQEFLPQSRSWKQATQFLGEVAGFESAYLHRIQLRELQQQQRLWSQLEGFLRRLHASFDLETVAHLAANEGRTLLECDQVAIGVRQGSRVHVVAISGASVLDRRSRLVQRMASLMDRDMLWGEKLVYNGVRDERLPPAVLDAQDSYLRESNSRSLVLLPLAGPTDGAAQPARMALLAEHFDSAVTVEQIEDRLGVIGPHIATAVHNAAEYSGLPLSSLGRGLRRLGAWLTPHGWIKVLAVCVLLTIAFGVLTVARLPLRLDARGQLLPRERRTVFAPVTGRIVEIKANNGDRVVRGQELLLLEDLETQMKVEQLTIKITAAEHRLAVLSEQLARTTNEEERDALVKERIDRKYELRKSQAEKGLLEQGGRNPRRAPVAAPLGGKVVTFDAREQLLGKTVKPGDPLLRVAQFQGPWEVVLDIPQENIAQVREGLDRSGTNSLEVALLLSSQPTHTYRGRLHRSGLAGETVVKDGAVVLPARVEILDPVLREQLPGLPVGVEVRAKLDCGPRALGYVWFGGVLEFLYERLWF